MIKNSRLVIKVLLMMIAVTLVLGVTGLTYAYFSLEIDGKPKEITMSTGDLRLEYKDGALLSLNNALPGDFITKTFTVSNVGTKKTSYNLIWNNLINTINNYDLHLDMKCKSYKNYNSDNQVEEGECNSFYKAVPYTETSIVKDIKRNNEIDAGITHVYNVTITFKNRTYNQNENLNKKFSGKINLEEYVDNSIYCTLPEETALTQGTEYVNGQYTYRYKQELKNTYPGLIWQNTSYDGWGVVLTDTTSTDPVTSQLCAYINDKPVVSMKYMFDGSQATSIDLSSFNTSNVISMEGMFRNSKVLEPDFSTFDTSNVTNMIYMFFRNTSEVLDLSTFDTSNVTDMDTMFYCNCATTLNLSSFDTSNVTNMDTMFYAAKATILDLSNFDTNNVTDMSNMFLNSQATIIDVSNLNTSNVTNMDAMFGSTKSIVLDVSGF